MKNNDRSRGRNSSDSKKSGGSGQGKGPKKSGFSSSRGSSRTSTRKTGSDRDSEKKFTRNTRGKSGPRENGEGGFKKSRNSFGDDRPKRPRTNKSWEEGKEKRPGSSRNFSGRKSSGNGFGEKRDDGFKKSGKFSDRPKRNYSDRNEGGDRSKRNFEDRPKRNYSDKSKNFEDRPKRNFKDKSEGFSDRPKRNYSDKSKSFNERPKRTYPDKSKDFEDRPKRNFSDKSKSYEDRPKRNFKDKSEGFSDRPKRNYSDKSKSFSDRPKRSYSDKPKDFEDRPKRNFNDSKKRSFSDGPKKSFSKKSFDSDGDRKGKRTFSDSKPSYKTKKPVVEKTTVEKKPDTGEIRLNRYISNSGICSRREADELIAQGLVKVNGEVITEMGFKVQPGDVVKYEDRVIKPEKLVYILLNKPKDFITTTDDPEGRKTVMDLVKNACKEKVLPVGRLDRNTTGLLLLTNDGELAKKLTHPSHMVKKIYQVLLDKPLDKDDFDKILKGIRLEDGPVKVDDLAMIDNDPQNIGLEIHEGRNRIVRRIFEYLGYNVEKLDRAMYAGLTKKDLPRGMYRFLTDKEVEKLKSVK